MPRVILPGALRARSGGVKEIEVEAGTAGEILRRLESDHPGLAGWVLDEQGHLREHVKIFVNDTEAVLDTPVSIADELFVVRAISGGADAPEGGGAAGAGGGAAGAGGGNSDSCELLVGTHKGLIVLRGARGGAMEVVGRGFAGQPVEYAIRDPRTGTYVASVTHGQFGPHLFFTEDVLGEWQEADGPAFPEEADASVKRIWVIEPGVEDGVLWAGVAPAALFRSDDNGRSWQLNQPLWDDPTRPQWQGGMGGLCLHSICPWPGEPSRLALGISAVGVWLTEDGGNSWRHRGEGLVPRYLPEEARDGTLMLCVHDIKRAPKQPETIYMQFHGGVYRSDDAGESWIDIGANTELPADFGFPMVIDPADPDRAFVIPLVSDQDRVTPEGKVRVYETRDRGNSWIEHTDGLPQKDAYLTVLRQAFCSDGNDPLGLYFGAESGELFGSVDGGASWSTLALRLPPIFSVRCSA